MSFTVMSDEFREYLAERVKEAEERLQEVRRTWYSGLPDFPADGRCECGNDGTEFGDWQHVEVGYQRWTNGEWAGDHLHLSTDGWDDMSEGGEFEWVECNRYASGSLTPSCGRAYKIPENMEYN